MPTKWAACGVEEPALSEAEGTPFTAALPPASQGISATVFRLRCSYPSTQNPAEAPTHSIFRLWSTPIINPRPMRMIVNTACN
jgi:hypothetical protein